MHFFFILSIFKTGNKRDVHCNLSLIFLSVLLTLNIQIMLHILHLSVWDQYYIFPKTQQKQK